MDHNWTSLGSTIDGELKLAAQLPKGDMILGIKKDCNKCYTFKRGVNKMTIFNKNLQFLLVFKLDQTGLYWVPLNM